MTYMIWMEGEKMDIIFVKLDMDGYGLAVLST